MEPKEALAATGLPLRNFAARVGSKYSTVNRWFEKPASMPEDQRLWLEALARWMIENPAPQHAARKGGRAKMMPDSPSETPKTLEKYWDEMPRDGSGVVMYEYLSDDQKYRMMKDDWQEYNAAHKSYIDRGLPQIS